MSLHLSCDELLYILDLAERLEAEEAKTACTQEAAAYLCMLCKYRDDFFKFHAPPKKQFQHSSHLPSR